MRIRVLVTPRRAAAPQARRGEPVTFGVPLPRGAVRDDDLNWQLVSDGAQDAAPLQLRVLDRWPDGSARWVLVDARITVGDGGDAVYFVDCKPPDDTPRITRGMPIAGEGDHLEVDTGVARFEVRTGDAFPIARLQTAGGSPIQADGCRLIVTDADGDVHHAVIDRVTYEERGPVRSLVKLTGRVRLKGDAALDVTA